MKFTKPAGFIVKYRYIILAVIVAIAAVCSYLITKVNINNDMTAYLPDSSNMKQGVDVMAKEFSDLSQPSTLRLMVSDLAEAVGRKQFIVQDVVGVIFSLLSYRKTGLERDRLAVPPHVRILRQPQGGRLY